jgi:hypothetical protein
VVAVTLRAQTRIRVTFRIGVRYQRHRAVARGTRRVTSPIPRCGSCTVMKVRIVASGTTCDTSRIAADRRSALRQPGGPPGAEPEPLIGVPLGSGDGRFGVRISVTQPGGEASAARS